jgi:hypothetical protein
VAADPDTGIITDEKLTKASGQENSDPAVAQEFVAAEAAGPGGRAGTGQAVGRGAGQSHGPGAGQDALAWYGDSAYGTGDLRDAIGTAGHRAVIKPGPLQSAVPGGFTVDDFTVDEQAGVVTCPAGLTRPITPGRNVIFGAACAPARCASGAPPPSQGGPSPCTPTMACCAPPAPPGPPAKGSARTTWPTGPTSNAPSPRSPSGAGAGSSSATAE